MEDELGGIYGSLFLEENEAPDHTNVVKVGSSTMTEAQERNIGL